MTYCLYTVHPAVRPSVRPSCFLSSAYLLYSLRKEFQIWCVDAYWDSKVYRNIFRSLWPWPWSSFHNNRVGSISPILFKEGIPNLVFGGIPNLVFGCILRWQRVAHHPSVPVALTLTSDLVSRNCFESGAYLLYSLRWELQIWCVNASWDGGVSHTYFKSLHVTLTSDLVLRIIVSLIFFEVEIPNLVCKFIYSGNLVCECILECQIVPFHFWSLWP